MYGTNSPFTQNGRASGQQVVDARSRSTTATDADQVPIIVKVQAVRSLDKETSYFPRQADRFPSSTSSDHNLQHQDLLLTLDRSHRPKNSLVTPMTTAGRIANGKRVFRSLNGLPKSAVPDLAIAGVSKSTFVASDTTQVNNVSVSAQVDGLTTVRNTGPETVLPGELVAVRAPPPRGSQGYQYSMTTKTGVIYPETYPLRLEMKEFSTYLDDATESLRKQMKDLAGEEDAKIKDSLENQAEWKELKGSLHMPERAATASVDNKIDVEEFRTLLRKDVKFLLDNAEAGTLLPDTDEDMKDAQSVQSMFREAVAFRVLALYFVYLRVEVVADVTTNTTLAKVYEMEQQTKALMSLVLQIINRKRRIVLGTCMQLSPGNGQDMSVNLRGSL
jgi:hypothetical protein